MKNKYAKNALLIAIFSWIYLVIGVIPFSGYSFNFYVIFSALIIFPLIAIGLGIKGLLDYKKDNSIGGQKTAITAIVIGMGMGIPLVMSYWGLV